MTDAATPETATASESLDLHGAARAIERLLRKDTATASAAVEGEAESRRAPAPEVDAAGEIAGASGEEPQEAEADDGDSDDQANQPGEPRHTVKVDGDSLEVPLSELIKGYQRGADYTRKTMRLADERREVEALREELDAELASTRQAQQHHAERLGRVIPALRQQLARFDGFDWARLSAENPALYARAGPVYDAFVGQLQQAEAEQLELQQRSQQEQLSQLQAYEQHLAGEKQALIAHLPEMADPAAGRRATAELARYLSEAGYRPDEMARLVDHRDFILARKAMLYDRLMATRDKVRQELAALPRVQQPGTAREPGQGARERRARMMRRLERSGRTEDAARLIEDLL